MRSEFSSSLIKCHLPYHRFAVALLAICSSLPAHLYAGQSADVMVAIENEFADVEAIAHISHITDNAAINTKGLVRVNITAGDGNVQQNSAAMAESSGVSSATIDANQYSDMITSDQAQILSTGINGAAFSGAQGVVQVNNSAGAGNMQFNGAAMAIGDMGAFTFIELNDEQLMDSAPIGTTSVDDKNNPVQAAEANLSPGAFNGASGIIQINQTAGNNNTAANSFTMSVSP